MRANQHVHTSVDGRGIRIVTLNGKIVSNVTYADTKRGIVRVARWPLRIDKHKKRVLTRTLRGEVAVMQIVGAGETAQQERLI